MPADHTLRIPSPLAGIFFSILVATSSMTAQEQPVRAGNPSFGIIDSVRVTGNEKTKDYVILDEMVLRPGVEATQQSMEFDRNRVYRLGLFNKVDMWCELVGGKVVLNVDVSERWYIIPLPVFGFAEGDVKKTL